MKLKLSNGKWCLAIIGVVVVNFRLSLLIMEWYGNSAESMRNTNVRKSNSSSIDSLEDNMERSHHNINNLPSFATDESEFLFGALIERSHDSWQLHVTVFFLCHYMLDPTSKNGVEKVHPATMDIWRQAMSNFQGISYAANGQRKSEPSFFCQIWNGGNAAPYISRGRFVPNRLTSDSNANRRLDILRCPMDNTKSSHYGLSRSSHDVIVEILRDGVSIIKFSIPWRTRKIGFMLSAPPAASRFDTWAGFEAVQEQFSPPQRQPTVHVCATGTKKYISKSVVPLYLEFVSHHLLLGASHIFLPVSVGWKSPHMQRYLQLFQSYIDEGKLTIVSQSGDGLDMINSVAGLTWNRLTVKVIQVNMCLYEAKGVADYVLVLDIDEYFIPKHPHKKIIDVIQAAESPFPLRQHPESMKLEALATNWKGGRGWADGDGHPFCYLSLMAEVVANKKGTDIFEWIGDRFSHGPEVRGSILSKKWGYKRAILPTRKIFQGSLSMGGACLQDAQWAGCGPEEFDESMCGEPEEPMRLGKRSNDRYIDFRRDHTFHEAVLTADGKVLNMDTEASIYHFLSLKLHHQASHDALQNKSAYTSNFFPDVKKDLESRYLHLVLQIYDTLAELPVGDLGWPPLFDNTTTAATGKEMDTDRRVTCIGDVVPPIGALDCRFTSQALSLPRLTSTKGPPPSPAPFAGPIAVPPVQKPSPPKDHPAAPPSTISIETVSLPCFSTDFSEFVLGSMIERSSDSQELWVTTFFLSHWVLGEYARKLGILKRVRPDRVDDWKRAIAAFKGVKYHESGERKQPPNYFCRIDHGDPSPSFTRYKAAGHFVPNNLSPTPKSNQKLDVFRCKMMFSRLSYSQLAGTNKSAVVSIVRVEEGREISLIKFAIPWDQRQTGYMMSRPSSVVASRVNTWKGFNKNIPSKRKADYLYMCSPGFDDGLSKRSLGRYVEFLQHHLLLGVDHIFISSAHSWRSPRMRTLLRILRSFIDEGRVSIVSSAEDGNDFVHSFHGLVVGNDVQKLLFINTCNYFAKGMADYVGVWESDDFFLPLGDHKTIQEVIRSHDSQLVSIPLHDKNATIQQLMSTWGPQQGFADNDGHPFCYLMVDSVVTLHRDIPTVAGRPPVVEEAWIGRRFSHGPEMRGHVLELPKAIFPTKKIYQPGLMDAGACRLGHPWSGCKYDDPFCLQIKQGHEAVHRTSLLPNGSTMRFHIDHRFDEAVLPQDVKQVDRDAGAVINRLLDWSEDSASTSALNQSSLYSSTFFPDVYRALDARGLTDVISLPEVAAKPFPERDSLWTDMNTVRDGAGVEMGAATTSMATTVAAGDEQSRTNANADPALELPQWAADYSELLLGSIIERVSDSWDLYLTTFFLSHQMVEKDPNNYSGKRIRNDSIATWAAAIQRFRKTNYTITGVRRNEKFHCRLVNSGGSKAYVVSGEFMPNRLAPDYNANHRVDILRCKINNAEDAYMELARSKVDDLNVQILREDSSHPTGLIRLISFSVSWATRCNGKSLWNPTHASTFDPWKGFDKGAPGVWSHDKIYMCVPGVDSSPSRKSLPILLEFIQHHLLMGIEHIFLTMPFSWESVHMESFVRILRSFIDEGFVSLTSHAVDGIDFLYSLLGASWDRDAFKIFQVNMCTYMMKGVVDYVGIWDVDEFFIPKGTHMTIGDVIDATLGHHDGIAALSERNRTGTTSSSQSRPGFADVDNHPYCYMKLKSQPIANREASSDVDWAAPWIGQRFAHAPEPLGSRVNNQFAFKKSIVPTRNIFQLGLHMHGACRLDSKWSGCDEGVDFCYKGLNPVRSLYDSFTRRDHYFDEVVFDNDTRTLNPHTEAVIYHVMAYRFYHAIANSAVLTRRNDYAEKFFHQTLSAIVKRNLDLLVSVPATANALEVDHSSPHWNWPSYELIRQSTNGTIKH